LLIMTRSPGNAPEQLFFTIGEIYYLTSIFLLPKTKMCQAVIYWRQMIEWPRLARKIIDVFPEKVHV
jgi:hypothetical protein